MASIRYLQDVVDTIVQDILIDLQRVIENYPECNDNRLLMFTCVRVINRLFDFHNNIINCDFNMNNIDRISATTIPDDYHVNVTVLNELIQCTDGILSLSKDSFCKDNIVSNNCFIMHFIVLVVCFNLLFLFITCTRLYMNNIAIVICTLSMK